GPDGPLYADFHALRHSYLTLGGRAGIDLRTLQELAGHSTPVLTARYSHRRLHDLAGAVEKLPNFLPDAGPGAEALRATGTDGAAPRCTDKADPRIRGACSALAVTSDSGGEFLRLAEALTDEEGESGTGRNPKERKPLRAAESGREG